MKNEDKTIYTAIILDSGTRIDELEGCMFFTCTNKIVLSRLTGIKFDRLVYIFTKLKRKTLYEDNILILRSEVMYKGKQQGGQKRGDRGY